MVDDLESYSQVFRSRLERGVSAPRAKGKVDRQVLIDAVLKLCQGRFATLRFLAQLFSRKPEPVRDQSLKTLVP